MAEYERAGQILPENGINSKISKSLVFDLPCESTALPVGACYFVIRSGGVLNSRGSTC